MNAPGDSLGWPAGEARLAEASAPVASDDAGLADIVRSSHDAIVGVTLDGVVTTWNRAAERLYGYRAEEIIGRGAEQLYPPGARAGEAVVLRRLARGERLDQYVTERIRRDGSTVTVRLSVSPIADDTGRIVGVAATSRRIHAAAEDGRDPRQPPAPAPDPAATNRTQGVLSTRTSHELRTPLQAVIGFTGTLLLRLPGPLNDEQERQLELVQESARQLLALINELSRPADG
ncbi:PAS domain S-box protein [Actinoplanes sp. NPDC049118]|uniref:PAS domain S-box protein n=1 Tax=Actinoplanes sp. NPDC049118 TaxID=3155769 RepID=UPI0033E8DE81